jgi:hypothetical protein
MYINPGLLVSLSLDEDGYPVSNYGNHFATHGLSHYKALYIYLKALANPLIKTVERFVAIGESIYSVDPMPNNLPGFWVEKVS